MQAIEIVERLERCYTGALYDAMREKGFTKCVLPYEIKPLNYDWHLAGPVFTVSGHREQGISEHETLLSWTDMLSKVPAGSVVVCQPNDTQLAHMGELSAETLDIRGARGYIVDGGCRDVPYILNRNFRVFCRYVTPDDIVGKWIVDSIMENIRIGEVEINNGDFIAADRDGIVVIPSGMVIEVLKRAEELMVTESELRKAIRQGMDPKQAYLKYGVF